MARRAAELWPSRLHRQDVRFGTFRWKIGIMLAALRFDPRRCGYPTEQDLGIVQLDKSQVDKWRIASNAPKHKLEKF